MASRDRFTADYRQIVEALIELRRTAGLTQHELAPKMGVDQSQLSKFERSERQMDILDFVRYCQGCGTDPGLTLKEILTSSGTVESGED